MKYKNVYLRQETIHVIRHFEDLSKKLGIKFEIEGKFNKVIWKIKGVGKLELNQFVETNKQGFLK